MPRPVSVTASAVIAIVGSVLALIFGVIAGASVFITPPVPQPEGAAVSAGTAAFLLIVGAVVGICTGIGLFQVRPWARVSILVIAGFIAAGSIPALLMTMLVPMPPDIGSSTAYVFRFTMASAFGIPLVVSVWWLFLFNRASTKAVFAAANPLEAPLRPISVTFIAWSCIAGAFFFLAPAVARTPAFLFGAILNGWAASAFYIFLWVAAIYIGKGLLELREHARILAILWFAYPVVHFGLVRLIPGMHQRMLDMQRQAMTASPSPSLPFDPGAIMTGAFAVSTIVGAIVIWFLVRNREAFKQGPISAL